MSLRFTDRTLFAASMDPSNLKSGLPMSPNTEEPLISLHFPQKLWRIINECTSGAISWSVDGKVVVIDYANFQSSYMYEQQEIFKTSNMRSFIRQLNLYGFRKVSPHDRVMAQYSSSTRGNTTSSGIHAFRNESFVRGRPDLLRRVTRKAGPPRAKRPRKVASGYQSSGSSTSSLSDEARRTQRQVPHSIMDCEADDTPSDMIALLDPNEPPTAVFAHFSPSPSGWEHAPRLEDCLLLSPVLSCLGQTPSDELSRLLMTDDDEDQDGTSGADQDQVLPAADAVSADPAFALAAAQSGDGATQC